MSQSNQVDVDPESKGRNSNLGQDDKTKMTASQIKEDFSEGKDEDKVQVKVKVNDKKPKASARKVRDKVQVKTIGKKP